MNDWDPHIDHHCKQRDRKSKSHDVSRSQPIISTPSKAHIQKSEQSTVPTLRNNILQASKNFNVRSKSHESGGKSEQLGVHGNMLSWIRCFLRERMAQVFVNGVAGETLEWKYGVPQGSVLSPLLFILFIDPMVSGLKCKSSLFADGMSDRGRDKIDRGST